MKDRTFSDSDVIRIYCNNLSYIERKAVKKFIKNKNCNSIYTPDDVDEAKEEKKDIELELELELHALDSVAFALGYFVKSYKDDQDAIEEKNKKLEAEIQEKVTAEIDELMTFREYMPAVDSKEYERLVKSLGMSYKIMRPCMWADEKYRFLEQKWYEVKDELQRIHDVIDDYTSFVSDLFEDG
jgi:hypothetical protein